VAAWESIVDDDEKRRRFHQDRGKGGFVRGFLGPGRHDCCRRLIHTIKRLRPGPDLRVHPDPGHVDGMLRLGFTFSVADRRSMISFYDWYCDLPPASPQIWGEQTDVPESADWYESTISSYGAPTCP
jgi:nitrate reductase alpha subunit